MVWNVLGTFGLYIGLAVVLLGILKLMDRLVRSQLSVSGTTRAGQAALTPIDALDRRDVDPELIPSHDVMPDNDLFCSDALSDGLESVASMIEGSFGTLDA